MNTIAKTIIPKLKDIEEKWILIDGKGQVLGRLASKIALLLRGKNSKLFTPHMSSNTKIIITNSKLIELTGKKTKNKVYYHHTGYPGGLKSITYDKALEKNHSFPLKNAVKGMLPKNKLSRELLKNLKIYPDNTHPHTAQKPVQIDV